MAYISISELSQTISELIDLDADQQSLLGSAIDRALDARKVVGGQTTIGEAPSDPPLINGIMPGPYTPDYFPIGRIANPSPTPAHPRPRHPRQPRPRRPHH